MRSFFEFGKNANSRKLTKKEAKKTALWNYIILVTGFCIITIATLNPGTTWNAAPAVLYYFINCAILTDKKSENNLKSPADVSKKQTYYAPQIFNPKHIQKTYGKYNIFSNDIRIQTDASSESMTSSNIQFCRKCGNKLADDYLFCNKNGTKIN